MHSYPEQTNFRRNFSLEETQLDQQESEWKIRSAEIFPKKEIRKRKQKKKKFIEREIEKKQLKRKH